MNSNQCAIMLSSIWNNYEYDPLAENEISATRLGKALYCNTKCLEVLADRCFRSHKSWIFMETSWQSLIINCWNISARLRRKISLERGRGWGSSSGCLDGRLVGRSVGLKMRSVALHPLWGLQSPQLANQFLPEQRATFTLTFQVKCP